MSVVMIREGIMTTTAPHLRVEELGARYRAATDVIEKSHMQAIWLLAKGHGKAEVGELLGFSRRRLNRLIARYSARGPESLGDQRAHNGTEATILTEAVLHVVAKHLAEPPADGGLWTGPKVAAVMAEALELKSVHPQRGWDALKKLGWSIQRPRPRHARAATEEGCAAPRGSPVARAYGGAHGRHCEGGGPGPRAHPARLRPTRRRSQDAKRTRP
jgi:transposase